ncbi:MAG: family 10 glycosylhydrolase [Acholeplasmataceae bacterium]|nr:family 10 glycosylhydrolase [Acholeplasmataceae bacterium]
MKLFKYKNPSEPICYYQTNTQIEIPETYVSKDFRAMWVSNVVNIDLPTTENIDTYQEKVIEMLDTCVSYNINAVFFQVRTTNDAFYESILNPYSRFLTGKEGKKPPFDVLKWIIEEARNRNIEFHAWCNPYRVSMKISITPEEYLEDCDDLNFAKKHLELTVLDKNGQIILNPAKKEVKQFIIDSMVELAEHYDVDGIHFDDYFYPYAGLSDERNDLADFAQRDNHAHDLGDFRRQNVTDVIKGVYEALKKVSPNLRFGVSPFGIWKNKASDPKGSNTDPKCSQSYDNQYADAYLWVKEGFLDYIVPQIYWEFGHSIAPFGDILEWWVKLLQDSKVDLYIGHGAYRLGNDGEFENALEIVNQLKYANQYPVVKGNVFFTYKTFINKDKSEAGMKEVKKLLTGGL